MAAAAPALPSLAEGRAAVRLWRQDPVRFATDVLGFQPWSRQAEILRAVAAHDRVAVRSGHKVGKSLSVAALALWFVCSFHRARVVMTAPTHRQIRNILWKELRRLYRGARIPLGGVMHELPDIGYQLADGREVVGFSTKEPERMAGISGPNVLFLVDEASGVPESIFQAIEGNRAGGAKIVLTSNPTMTSGTFFSAFNDKREFWHAIHVSSLEVPAGVPGLATREWIDEKRREWGSESPLFYVRVLGEFPSQPENAVIGLALVEAAESRWSETAASGPLVLGVDPARFGDDESVIVGRRGFKAFRPAVFLNIDEHALAVRVIETAQRLRETNERVVANVDGHGVGAGVISVLRQSDACRGVAGWLTVNDVRSGDPSSSPDQYVNLRTQLHFAVAEWLEQGGAIPDDPKLHGELVAPTYAFDGRNRRKVEAKEEIKRRLGRSPDRADSLALAVFTPTPLRVVRPTAAPTPYRLGGARGF